jgi:response regulator RpfG family c-di-GMP phosphodiesterase
LTADSQWTCTKTVLTIQVKRFCNNPMGWSDWMVVSQSLEEELEVERSVREVKNCTDEETLKTLCTSLVRQNWHQSKLLSQAVGRIGELDAKVACSDF